MNDVACKKASKRQTKLMRLFVKCGVVELMKKILKEFANREELKRNEELPSVIETLLAVNRLRIFSNVLLFVHY